MASNALYYRQLCNTSGRHRSHQMRILLQVSAVLEVGETGGFLLSKWLHAAAGHHIVFHDCHYVGTCVRERDRDIVDAILWPLVASSTEMM